MTENFNALIDEIATAPGDLPLGEIIKRQSFLRHQFRHDNTMAPLAPGSEDQVQISAISGSRLAIKSAAIWYTTDGSIPDNRSNAVPMQQGELEWEPLAKYLVHWQGAIPPQPAGTIVRYKIAGWLDPQPNQNSPDYFAMDGQGFWFHHSGDNKITIFAYQVTDSPHKHPEWMNTAVIYQIFLDRFHPGTADGKFQGENDPRGFHGGTLKGAQQALPYLADLGINCLWLSPITVADTYHRYDSKDYFAIDPRLGSNDDLRQLTREAHNFGMRVLLDFVPSHCSWHHPAFLGAQQSQDAATYSWFTFYDWPEKYRCFLDMVPFLPSFDTNDPGGRKYIIDSALYWMREFDIDGYRLDHAIGHGMDFWIQFKTALESENPEVVTIGEATDTPDSLRKFRGRLNDFLDFPLARALRHTFATRDWLLQELDSFLEVYDQYMDAGPGRVSFLDNHDMERFAYLAGENFDSLKIAALCQFSLEQTPTIYYGTEIGLSQEHSFSERGFGGDAEARRDMPWDPNLWDQNLLRFYQRLIQLRKEHAALRSGIRNTLHIDNQAGTYVYVCGMDKAAPLQKGNVMVAFNLGKTDQSLSMPTAKLDALLLTNDLIEISNAQIRMPPNSGAWIILS